MTHGKGKSRFEMQDTHKCCVPFGEEAGSGLFLVFDGHAGKVSIRRNGMRHVYSFFFFFFFLFKRLVRLSV